MNHTNRPALPAKPPALAAGDAALPAAFHAAALAAEAPAAVGAGQPPAAEGAPQVPVQPALAFAQWLGLEQVPPAAADGAAAAVPEGAPVALETPVEEQQPHADAPLLGAMTMPLMPITQAALAAAVAALPVVPVAKEAAPASTSEAPSPSTASTAPAAAVAPRADAPVAAATGARAPAAATVSLAPAAATVSLAPAATPALPAEPAAAHSDAPQDPAAPSAERGPANIAGVAAPAAGSAPRSADTVTLSGPPLAWRQTLQEALGDRLQLQLGKNAEQAVIRLEPPMLGRVDIAIRHSAGSLEVHISATNGEVLRQLQAVGENLRSDLAQRQFTDVAVNIAAAPRAAAAGNTSMFAGDGNGRGRQQDGAQDEQQPGDALAEANTGAAPFSLNGTGKRRA